MKKYNFCAGPSILPQEVLAQAAEAITNFNGSGLSLLEISHRTAAFDSVMDEARTLAKELLNIPNNYEVLFMQGGASSQFYTIPANFLSQGDTAGYIDTGVWSTKAIKESKRYGTITAIASSADENYSYIPKEYTIPDDLKYLHITSNNTIYGTEYHDIPRTSVPLMADMSSNIYSRPIDVSDYQLIYAGAQKNIGTAGATMIIINKDFLREHGQDTPSMINYGVFVDRGSLFNTPPVFAIYVSMLTLRWIKKQGGVKILENRNIDKANLLYDTIDNSSLFKAPVRAEDRSRMNVSFKMYDKSLEEKFLEVCEKEGCVALKGHRSVGGLRASIYNAMSIEGVQLLSELITDFDRRHA